MIDGHLLIDGRVQDEQCLVQIADAHRQVDPAEIVDELAANSKRAGRETDFGFAIVGDFVEGITEQTLNVGHV